MTSPLAWYEALEVRVNNFHAFTLGDRAAMDDFPHNPYVGHNDTHARYWQQGFLGFPFEQEQTNE